MKKLTENVINPFQVVGILIFLVVNVLNLDYKLEHIKISKNEKR